jgi:tetratricopeptide (TPR) repeat protein
MEFFRRILPVLMILLLSAAAYGQGADRSGLDALQNYRTGRDLEARGRMQDATPYYNEAVRLSTAAIERNGADIEAYVVLTWTLNRQQRYADVIAWGQRGLNRETDYRIVETMGEAYFYLDRYAESLASMQRYTNAAPQGERASVAYFFIGEIYRIQGKNLHADMAYSAAVRLDPGASLWWYRLGQVREAAGERLPAIEAYERALRLNPSYTQASEGLARVRN